MSPGSTPNDVNLLWISTPVLIVYQHLLPMAYPPLPPPNCHHPSVTSIRIEKIIIAAPHVSRVHKEKMSEKDRRER